MSRRVVLAVHPGAELFGSDRMFLESVAAFTEAGDDVVVALPEDGPLVAKLVDLGARVVLLKRMFVLRKALLRPSGWGTLVSNGFSGFAAALRLLARVRPEVVYVSTIILPQWPLVARLRRARVVCHVHEAEGSINRWVNRVMYFPLTAAHRVVVNSEYCRETLGSVLPYLTSRTRLVYNGIASPEHPRAARRELTGTMRVCYVGRLSARKGPDLVLDAARTLAGDGTRLHVTLVGAVFPGNEWYGTALSDAAAALPPHVAVDFVGFDPDVWSHLAASDAIVVPSRLDESFGNTAVEGVLALRPVVASDIRGLREAVGGYASATLVPPDDAAGFADALRRLRANWPAVIERSAEDRARALERHAPARYRGSMAAALGD